MAKLTLQRLATWDESLCLRFNRVSHRRWVRILLRTASRLGDGVFWYALMGALLLAYGQLALIPVLKMLLSMLATIS